MATPRISVVDGVVNFAVTIIVNTVGAFGLLFSVERFSEVFRTATRVCLVDKSI